MNYFYILKLANKFYSFASDNLDNFAQNVKKNGKGIYKNNVFIFSDSDLLNDRSGEYIFSYFKLKDGSVIIEYNINNKKLFLIGSKGIVETIDNATLNDVDILLSRIDNLLDLDEISTSYENPGRELKLDNIYRSFRSDDTNLLEVVENTLGVKIPHGEMIGTGAEGEVYDYGHGKIIKFFLLPDNKKEQVLSFLKRIESVKCNYISKIYNSGIAIRIGQKLLVGNISSFDKPIWIAYYIADKVFPIKGDRDQTKIEKLRNNLKNELGLVPWDFDENPDNIMQDIDGNYKYVDFGSVADFLKIEK